jgi:NAD(P)-dependent dehydrogenase (short-subunit alcohol dehydrogenase family)
MDLGLGGKKALVTGGTRGLGRHIALTLLEEGCDVAICGLDELRAQQASRALSAGSGRCIGHAVDVADRDAVRQWIDRICETLGGIDIVVSNATGAGVAPDAEGWRKSVSVDLMGAVHVVEAAREPLERSASAAVLLIASIGALESGIDLFPPDAGQPHDVVKSAILGYMGNLSRSLAPAIRVNAVSPGPLYVAGGPWEQLAHLRPGEFEKVRARCLLGRLATAGEVARAVAFLVSPAAAAITGTNLVVDAGMTRRYQF